MALSELRLAPGEAKKSWFAVKDKEKEQGEIHIEFTYFPIG